MIVQASSNLKHIIDVWYLNLEAQLFKFNWAYFLSHDEQTRVDRFKFKKHATDYGITRAVLRCLLARYTQQAPQQIQFTYTQYGKPQLVYPEQLQFNVSHSGSIVVYAFTWLHPLGVDVERIAPLNRLDALIERCFSESDQNYFKQLTHAEKLKLFFKGWVRKEALLKASGKGLSYPLKKLTVPLDNDLKGIVDWPDHGKRWFLYSLPDLEPDFMIALATQKEKRINLKGWVDLTLETMHLLH